MKVIWALQKGIYNKLTDATEDLIGKVSGIYHYVPQHTTFPYVVIAENKAKEISNFSESVFEVQTKIEVFDRSESNEDLLDIMNDIVVILKRTSDFVITGYNLIDSHFLSANSFLMDDGKTWKGELFFSFIVKEV
jgi:hypothetical protein